MKKEIIVSLIVMVVALAAASILAPVLQGKQLKINPDKERLSGAPVGGMHKVVADWEWMGFINYLGNLQTVDETNVKEVAARLERLMRLDPKFERLYLDGLSFIQHADPKRAVEMLDSACHLDYLRNNWKIPFFTGFIYSRNTYDIKDQNGPPLMSADHAKAAEYFRMALERTNGSPEKHLVNCYIREVAKAEATGTSDDREHLAKLRFLLREWKNSQNSDVGGLASLIPDIKDRLRSAIQDASHPHDIYGRDYEPSVELRELVDKIRQEIFADENLCQKCLHQSKPGSAFCMFCGEKLSNPSPVCPKCSSVLDGNSKFCPNCGEPVGKQKAEQKVEKKAEQKVEKK